MASLLKKCRHGRERWDTCACAWYIKDHSGGRAVYTNAGPDKAVALRALARHGQVAEETIGQALDAWLAAKAADPNARDNSIATYRTRVEKVREVMGHLPVRGVRAEHIIAFTDDYLGKGYAPATVQGYYACLTATLKHAQRRGVIKTLPLPPDGPGIPDIRPREHHLTLEQVEGVISEMPGVWGKVAELILLTGLRWGEAVAIRPEDIDGKVLRVRRTRTRGGGENAPKTRRGERVVPLSRRALAILAELKLPVGGHYQQAHDALIAALGDLHRPGMGWHVIRNAHATLLERAGVPLRDQAARMGHGVNYAQTLAYGLASQAGDADVLDAVRPHGGSPSGGQGEVLTLESARARRRRAP